MDIIRAHQILNGVHWIEGESDNEIVDYVRQHAARLKPGVTAVPSLHGRLPLRPLNALHDLARSRMPQNPQHIFNFHQMLLPHLYMGAFDVDAQSGQLTISAGVRAMNSERRRLFSEEMGVGIGIALAKQWCRNLFPSSRRSVIIRDVVDVNDILEHLTPSRGAHITGPSRPDYLLQYSEMGSPTIVRSLFLECKGTKNYYTAKRQLARGVGQLTGATVHNRSVTSLVISTITSDDHVKVLSVDPPESAATLDLKDFELSYADDRESDIFIEESTSESIDFKEKPFLSLASAYGAGRLAAYAGDFSTAGDWHPRFKNVSSPDTDATETSETFAHEELEVTKNRTFVGHRYYLPTPDGNQTLSIFQGVESSVQESLHLKNLSNVLTNQNRIQQDKRNTEERLNERTNSIASVHDDGSCFVLELEG